MVQLAQWWMWHSWHLYKGPGPLVLECEDENKLKGGTKMKSQSDSKDSSEVDKSKAKGD